MTLQFGVQDSAPDSRMHLTPSEFDIQLLIAPFEAKVRGLLSITPHLNLPILLGIPPMDGLKKRRAKPQQRTRSGRQIPAALQPFLTHAALRGLSSPPHHPQRNLGNFQGFGNSMLHVRLLIILETC